ncbi:MAG: prolyl oligopeptidase family serine peptidase [Pseudohongiellaceae bacterium]
MKQFSMIVTILALLLSSACGEMQNERYASVDDRVSFADVQALTFRAPDLEIVYGNEPLQYGSLWLPEEPKPEGAPLVAMIHGGCWENAYGVDHVWAFSTALADAGFAVWSLEYRRTGDAGGGWPGSYEDVITALTATPSLSRHEVDTGRMVVVGHSAGGQLGLLAGGRLPGFQATIGLAAITDIVRYARGDNSCQQATEPFMGGSVTGNESRYRTANPVDQPLHERTILLHGTADELVRPDHANLEGADTRLVEGAGHFDWIHPGTRAFRTLVDTLDEVLAE